MQIRIKTRRDIKGKTEEHEEYQEHKEYRRKRK